MEQEFKVSIESDNGSYADGKEFRLRVKMSPDQFLKLCEALLDHLELNKLKPLAVKEV